MCLPHPSALVKTEKYTSVDKITCNTKLRGPVSTWGLQKTKTGLFGDPTSASAETGRHCLEASVQGRGGLCTCLLRAPGTEWNGVILDGGKNCRDSTVTGVFVKNTGQNLIGIYLHGSLAFGCFHPLKAILMCLQLLRGRLPSQKKKVIHSLLSIWHFAPEKGYEMSIVLEKVCRRFAYPTRMSFIFQKPG